MSKPNSPPAMWIAGEGFGSGAVAALAAENGQPVTLFRNPPPGRAGIRHCPLPRHIPSVEPQLAAAAAVAPPAILLQAFLTAYPAGRLDTYDEATLNRAYWELDAYSLFGRRAAAHMPPGSVLVNLVSACGLVPAAQQPLASMVSAAVIAMTRAWALELAADGIRVCAVAAGLTRPIAESLAYTAADRAVTPEDIHALVSFLAGAGSEMINGACLPLEGGYVAGYCRSF